MKREKQHSYPYVLTLFEPFSHLHWHAMQQVSGSYVNTRNSYKN